MEYRTYCSWIDTMSLKGVLNGTVTLHTLLKPTECIVYTSGASATVVSTYYNGKLEWGQKKKQ